MCGIAGTINFPDINLENIKKSLFHRGPDQQSIYTYNNIHFIHTRLSIQDVAHGHQPFEFKNYVIVFNGEIYNHLELRLHYLKEFVFQTSSDTETLLYLYIKYNKKMFHFLDGMFAFAILDKNKNEIVFARDRAGKKPLYIYKKSDKLMFASELNTLKENIENLAVNEEHIYAYLRTGFFYKKTTPYKDVFECEASYIYTLNIENMSFTREKFFDILDFYQSKKIDNFDFAKEQLDQILHRSIKDRLLSSDLEVGAFLSGGIDSSIIVAIAAQYTDTLKTFTVQFESTFDESHLAALTAKKYNTQHTQINISLNLKQDIEKIICNYGEPFMDSSAVPSFYVSQEAKKYVSVILNGDGADELFGGYRRYVPIANNWIKVFSKFSFLSAYIPPPNNKKTLYNYLYRLLSMSGKQGIEFYLSATNDIFEDVYEFDHNSIFVELDNYIKAVSKKNISELSKQLYLDFNLILFSDLLVKMDIATMSHSLEGRSPFLSKYMLETIPTFRDDFKIQGRTTKFILRELAKKYLPQELINQPKRGFEVPLKNWVEHDLKEEIFSALDGESYSQNFIEKDFLRKLLYNKTKVSREKRAKILWTLYSLEVWKKNLK